MLIWQTLLSPSLHAHVIIVMQLIGERLVGFNAQGGPQVAIHRKEVGE